MQWPLVSAAAAADPCRYCVMIPELLILAEISPVTLFITCNRIELSLIDWSLIEIGSGWLVPVPSLSQRFRRMSKQIHAVIGNP